MFIYTLKYTPATGYIAKITLAVSKTCSYVFLIIWFPEIAVENAGSWTKKPNVAKNYVYSKKE